jgi:hypothetical protein
MLTIEVPYTKLSAVAVARQIKHSVLLDKCQSSACATEHPLAISDNHRLHPAKLHAHVIE